MKGGTRRRPSHDLDAVQLSVRADPDGLAISDWALAGAARMEMDGDDVVECVLNLAPDEFVKSVESRDCPGEWQDEYNTTHLDWPVYLKLCMEEEGPYVISFKPEGST